MADAQISGASRRFLTFRLDRRLYALPAEEVVEVIRLPQVAKVPQAPKALIGVANLRGTVLPLASLRVLLGGDDADLSATRAIVLDGAAPAAIAVDGIEALVTVAAEKIETRQAELAARGGEKLIGAFEVHGQGIAKIVDIKALLDDVFAARAQRKRQPAAPALGAVKTVESDLRGDAEVLVTFDVAGQEYALALSAVQEIVPSPETITAMPHAEELVVGMMAFRDQLLPLLSLRGLLGFKPGVPDASEKVLVTSVGGAVVGLVADRVRAVIQAERELIDPVPSVLAARSGGETRIAAIYRGDAGKRLISILAPDRLFREDVMQRIGPARQGRPQADAAARSAERRFVVFRLGDDEFGLPIESVDEVARVPEQVTRIPRTPKFLEGVVNLRGEVLPVVDQRRRFDMPVLESGDGRRLIVVRTERHRAGLIVDSVSEVLRCAADAIEPPPDLTGDITRLVHGVVNLEGQGRIVLLLDPAELLTRAEHGLLDAFEAKAKAAK
ncbi:MAG: chemotaxis protein CheW [Rhizomicrobium sp.]